MNIANLLEKYCKAGPRYTSYPTAPYFHEGFTDADWDAELAAGQGSGRGLSLYVHIPFCDTLCWYCGCNMVATQDYGRAERYLEVLFQEIDRVADRVGGGRVVRQLHWGGGTPTFLRPEDMTRLIEALRNRFPFAADAEMGCEADPRELTREQVRTLKALGFNRISLGVQDLDDTVQQAVHRVQPETLIREVYGWMREEAFESVNMDLMVGLPHQSLASFAPTLDAVIAMYPDRLAVFNYAHVPWMKKHQKLIRDEDLPDVHTRIALQNLILERLTDAGYVYVGMDHYAKPDDELVIAQRNKTLYRNFQGYTTHKDCDILAFGASAISQTEDVYMQNLKKLSDYQQRVQAGRLATERGLRIGREDKLHRDAISRVMCDLELDIDHFCADWQVDFDRQFGCRDELREMEADGLLQLDGNRLRVTDVGRLFLRNIAMLFDAYQRQPASGDAPRYSKTI